MLIETLLVLFPAANEDGANKPHESRRKHGPPTRSGAWAPLLWIWGPHASSTTGFSPKHATSADVHQHGTPHGPWRHAAPFHAPGTDGPSLWSHISPGAPTGHDGTTRHAETSRLFKEHGSPRPSWHGTWSQRDAGPPWWNDGPTTSRNGSQGFSGASTSRRHDATSGEHDGTPGSYDGSIQDTWQHVQQFCYGQHAGPPRRDTWTPREHAGAPG